MSADHYAALGLSIDATAEEIRSAYFEAARRTHPDATQETRKTEWFLRVQEAYEVLSNSRRRVDYDASLPDGLMAQPAVAVHVRTSRNSAVLLTEPQLFYVLLEINCTADMACASSIPAHICFVIDRSTSMQGDRMDMVKANLTQALHRLKPADLVSIVSFSDRAEVVVPPTRVSAFSKMESRVYSLQTGGGTEIYQGLVLGVEQLRSDRSETSMRQLILLTDGQTYGDEEACLALAEAACQDGIGMSALGIGHEWNDTFLDKLTGISGGSTMFVRSTKNLGEVLEQIMRMAGSVYARGVTLEFTPDANSALRYAFRLQPDVGALQTESPLVLGNLQRGKSLTLLLEIVAAPLADETEALRLLNGRLKMQVFDQGVKRARMFVDVRLPLADGFEVETPAAAVMEAVSRMTLYRMQENARKQVEAGEADKAARQLQFMATRLLSQGNRELAHTVLAEAEHIRHSRVFTKDGDKRVKYGTRALLLPSGMESRS